MGEYLEDLRTATAEFVYRADFPQTSNLMEDPLYRNDNLLFPYVKTLEKRKVDEILDDYDKVDHVNETFKKIRNHFQGTRTLPETFITDKLVLSHVIEDYSLGIQDEYIDGHVEDDLLALEPEDSALIEPTL